MSLPSASRRTFLAGLGGLTLAATSCEQPAHRTGTAPAPRTAAPATTQPRRAPASSPTPAPARTPGRALPDLISGPSDRPLVALTFHGAGDPALTRQALHVAKQHEAGLTVLAVGQWLKSNRALSAVIRDGGHDLGNHTWSHQAMRELDPTAARHEVERAADLLTQLTGSPGRWFRPSGTPRSTATIRAAALSAGYARCLAYDVDPLDYTDPGPSAVTRRTLAAVRPGSIVSLHLGHPGTVAALPAILTGLRRKGLRAVTVSDLVDGTA